MAHWYPWATREYILEQMTYGQLIMYYKYIPAEGRLSNKDMANADKPDRQALKMLMQGKKVFNK